MAILKKPIIYLAGKIAPHDWREQLVGRGVELGTSDERKLFDPSYTVNLPDIVYGGPFYIACDHKCAHGAANHGVGASGEAGCLCEDADPVTRQRRVFEVNKKRIANADIVFAFINQRDCFGTFVELGIATASRKSVIVVLGDHMSARDMRELWMVRECANSGRYVGRSLDYVWKDFLQGIRDATDRHNKINANGYDAITLWTPAPPGFWS